MNVATRTCLPRSWEGAETVYRYLYQPEHARKSPMTTFRELCERTWFYYGDHERTRCRAAWPFCANT